MLPDVFFLIDFILSAISIALDKVSIAMSGIIAQPQCHSITILSIELAKNKSLPFQNV